MTPDLSDAERRVLDRITTDEIVALTRELVAAPGENPPGEEQATADVLASAARERGLVPTMTEVLAGRPNVSVRTIGGEGPGLLLLGHTDVVPVGDGWTVSPTGGEIRDGRLYGRGSTDMKGGLAACLVAMSALQAAGIELRGAIELAAVIDEEDTGEGIRHYLAERAHASATPSEPPTDFLGCVVAEPTDLQTIIAARGAAYVQVTVTGRAAHAGNPADGANAIYGAAAVVAELERWHHEMSARAHPLAGPPSWSVNLLQAGSGPSIVPAEAAVTADRRLLPSETPAQVLTDTRARLGSLRLVERGLGVEVEMPMDMPGFETPADHPFVVACDAALADAGGPGLPLGGWTAACDGGFVARDEGVPVVVIGPGSVQTQAHRADESVGVDELLTAARAYALMGMRLLG